jgi:FAD/FMN-containing dehydrogenase
VIPFGARSSLEGQVLATDGGVALSTAEMKRIVQVNVSPVAVATGGCPGCCGRWRQAGEAGLWSQVSPAAAAACRGAAGPNVHCVADSEAV